MSVEPVSTGITPQQVQEQAAVQVESMAIRDMEAQSAAMTQLFDSGAAVSDPSLGTYVDMLA